jgi:outer membrane receptor protein involved in Fe transport
MSKVRQILLGSFALLALLVAPSIAAAQTGTVQGQVVDAATGRPLPSAQVSIDGTGLGGLSNQQGRFLILNVPVGQQTVRALLIGYSPEQSTVTVTVGQTATVDFRLGSSALEMEEIVVTGTGRPTERRRLSAEVSVVGAADIEASAATNVTELLQGRVPGAQINAISASPGTAGLMSFRGPSSAIADQTPVIYIDGVRVDNARGIGSNFGGEATSALADLPVTDIERIEVTKGGAASTLFGADAASGVIQIFTKRGRPGEARFTARMEQGWDSPETKFISDVDFAYPEASYPDLRNDPSWDPDFVKNSILQTGGFQSYYLGAVGGSANLGYSISGRIQDSEGVQHSNNSTQYSLQSGIQAQLSETLTADFSGSYLRHNFERVQNGTTTTGALTNVEVGDFLFFSKQDNLADALDVYERQSIDEKVDRFTLSSTLGWTPSTLFDARATVGIDKRVSEQRHIEDIDMVASSRNGAISVNTRDFTGLTMDFRGTFSYEVPFFTSTSSTVGFQGFRESAQTLSVQGVELALPGVTEFDAAALITANEGTSAIYNGGFFFLQQAGIADQLFLEAGVRFDGNTAFGSDVSYQAYPKVGASYDLTAAGVGGDIFQTLRLRANYGATGKFPPPFLRDRTFEAEPFRGESAPRFDNPGNADLTPERVTTIEGGLDVSFWQNRVGLTLTGYRAITTDALFVVNEQPSTGQLSQLRNIGEIENKGLEFSANIDVIRRASAVWNVGLGWSMLRNKVVDMGGLAPFQLSTNEGRRPYGRIEEGYPIGVRYMSQPIDTNNDGLPDSQALGIVCWPTEKWSSGTDGYISECSGDPETDDYMTPYPTSNGSINTSLTLPDLGLSISAMGDWSRGGTVQDYGAAWASFNRLPRIKYPTQYNLDGSVRRAAYNYSSAFNYFLVKGDYFKLREVTVRYELPESFAARIGAGQASISVSGRNLWTWVPGPQSIFNPGDEGCVAYPLPAGTAEADGCPSRRYLVDPELAGYADPSSGGLALGGSQSVALPPAHQFRFAFQISF